MPGFGTKDAVAQVSVANTNRDGTGTLATVVTGATNGSQVFQVTVVATGTTTAGVVRLFIDDGTNKRLIAEILVTAITPGVLTAVFSATWTPVNANGAFGQTAPLNIPNGSFLKASTNNAETFNLIAKVQDN